MCEGNFARVLRLVPDLARITDGAVARVPGKPALHLRLLERSAFTMIVELTHDFTGCFNMLAEPAVRIKVCFDAGTVEMLCDSVRPLVHDALLDVVDPSAVLDYKWSMNYFLTRWLDHCVRSEYRFCTSVAENEPTLVPA